MSSTHASAEPSTAEPSTAESDGETRRFRAATIDAALADARGQLGDVEIVEANRIRRGGVGGFFATDLGVELVVRPATANPALAPRDGLDDEYVDTTVTGALPRFVDRSRDDRPPFYDRVREEAAPAAVAADRPRALPTHPHAESITAELERLLTAATTAERSSAGRRPTRSFADHLADHLGADDEPARAGRPSAAPAATPDDRTEPAAMRRRPAPTPAATEADGAHHPDAAGTDAPADRDGDTSTAPRGAATVVDATVVGTDPIAAAVVEADVVEATEVAAAEPQRRLEVPEIVRPEPLETPREPNAEPTTARRSARTPATRDPWRKSIDLAAGAVGRLVEQLSDVAPAEGSRMRSLSRLTVSVTTPDGAVIELTAELEGDE